MVSPFEHHQDTWQKSLCCQLSRRASCPSTSDLVGNRDQLPLPLSHTWAGGQVCLPPWEGAQINSRTQQNLGHTLQRQGFQSSLDSSQRYVVQESGLSGSPSVDAALGSASGSSAFKTLHGGDVDHFFLRSCCAFQSKFISLPYGTAASESYRVSAEHFTRDLMRNVKLLSLFLSCRLEVPSMHKP